MKIRNKILLFLIPLAACMAVVVWTSLLKAVRNVIVAETTQRALDQAVDVAKNLGIDFLPGNELRMLADLKSFPLDETGYGAVLGQDGTVLAHTNILEKGKRVVDPVRIAALAFQEPTVKVLFEERKPFLTVFVPIWGNSSSDNEFLFSSETDHPSNRRRLGTLMFAYPLEKSFQIGIHVANRIMLIIGVSFFLTLIVVLMFVEKISKPIALLLKGTQRIAGGEYGTTIEVLTKDELGKLTSSFNQMSTELSRTTVSKDFLTGVMSCMSDALLVWNMDGKIRMVNQAAAHLLGYEEAELLGKNSEILFNGENGLFVGVSISFKQVSLLRNAEISMCSKGKEPVPVLASAAPLLGNDGHPQGIVFVAKDISDRKKMERRLAQSEKMSAVGQLAAGVAHEINNPLGIILGFAQGLVRRMLADDPNELPLRTIEREALRCKNLVQDLLTFSRASKTDREPLDLNKCVSVAMGLIQTQAKLKQVEVKCELTDDLPRILANANQIEQIIVNLAGNAYDAMPNGGKLTLKTELQEGRPQSWVCLRVTDTGIGIPKEIQERIFEPFFTTKPVGKGTGLGLGMVYEIVKKHSGTIDLESRPGLTEFIVKLPVHSARTTASTTAT